jgi:hypothetical protein
MITGILIQYDQNHNAGEKIEALSKKHENHSASWNIRSMYQGIFDSDMGKISDLSVEIHSLSMKTIKRAGREELKS